MFEKQGFKKQGWFEGKKVLAKKGVKNDEKEFSSEWKTKEGTLETNWIEFEESLRLWNCSDITLTF